MYIICFNKLYKLEMFLKKSNTVVFVTKFLATPTT